MWHAITDGELTYLSKVRPAGSRVRPRAVWQDASSWEDESFGPKLELRGRRGGARREWRDL